MKRKQINFNYLYIFTNPSSEYCGEAFFVYASSKSEADLVAYHTFGEIPHFAVMYTDAEADNMGFDIY